MLWRRKFDESAEKMQTQIHRRYLAKKGQNENLQKFEFSLCSFSLIFKRFCDLRSRSRSCLLDFEYFSEIWCFKDCKMLNVLKMKNKKHRRNAVKIRFLSFFNNFSCTICPVTICVKKISILDQDIISVRGVLCELGTRYHSILSDFFIFHSMTSTVDPNFVPTLIPPRQESGDCLGGIS